MKKIVLSVAAVAMLAGFVAGCAQPEKPAPAVIRKG
jgi:predicted small lipoprotein YifL